MSPRDGPHGAVRQLSLSLGGLGKQRLLNLTTVDLMSMETTFIPKNKRLQEYVQYFWLLKHPGDNSGCPILPPEAVFDVILSFGESTTWETRDHRIIELKGSFLGGIREEPVFLDCQRKVDYLAIRFYPDKFHQLLNFPMSEISNQVIELDLFPGTFWRHLTEKIAGFHDVSQKIAALEYELLALLGGTQNPSKLIETSLSLIHTSRGTQSINSLSDQLGVYPKSLEREFKNRIGLPPKRYSRIVRINHVIEHLSMQNSEVEWVDIAYEYGYFDQSHFIKEFTQFLGLSPEQYRKIVTKI